MKYSILGAALAAALFGASVAQAYQAITVTNGGALTGKVTYAGKDPDPVSYTISKDPQTCGKGPRQIDYVKVNNGALQEVVVFLFKVEQGKAFPADLKAPVIDQKGCEFKPYFSTMRNGDKITVLNSDGVLHNVHLFELIGTAKRTFFNMNHPADLKSVSTVVDAKRGNAIKLECDAHDFMHGFVFVADNPYYAVVDKNGGFRIDGIPPGEYKVKAWHPTLGEQRGKVTVTAGGTATLNLEFKGQ